jgi:carbon-monoxide dehydrogenase iron sulfur subunit
MGPSAVTKENHLQKSNYQFNFNGDICLGCGTCVSVCSIYKEGVINDLLARIKLARHIFEIEYTVDFCRQCHHAECYYACPEDAIGIHPKTGARVIDESACTGCKLCMVACPFNMISFSRERNVALKCDFCDGEPQCVKFCPSGALSLLRI